MELILPEQIAVAAQKALRDGLIDDLDTTVLLMERSILEDRIERLNRCFPDNSLHAIAIKTNPLSFVLESLVTLGVGLEAASFGELLLAKNAALLTERLVFDSPAKTQLEIDRLMQEFSGARVNCDSLAELERYPSHDSGLRLGIRVNPNVESATVDYMNVGGASSKFGESISRSEDIVKACVRWKDVDCLHLHIGSQATDFGPNVVAIKKICELAAAINSRAGHSKISSIDIGGGFPVNYSGAPYRIEEYAAAIQVGCPELFDGTFRLITEFGRYVHANTTWAITRIEYVKQIPGGTNLITHAGADLFLRECYHPDDWFHELMILDSKGVVKTANIQNTNVAGPLCFGGDFIAHNRSLPAANPGDFVVIRDVGANSFSLWSRHCSRPFPKVLAYRHRDDEMAIVKQRESLESIVQFWS